MPTVRNINHSNQSSATRSREASDLAAQFEPDRWSALVMPRVLACTLYMTGTACFEPAMVRSGRQCQVDRGGKTIWMQFKLRGASCHLQSDSDGVWPSSTCIVLRDEILLNVISWYRQKQEHQMNELRRSDISPFLPQIRANDRAFPLHNISHFFNRAFDVEKIISEWN